MLTVIAQLVDLIGHGRRHVEWVTADNVSKLFDLGCGRLEMADGKV